MLRDNDGAYLAVAGIDRGGVQEASSAAAGAFTPLLLQRRRNSCRGDALVSTSCRIKAVTRAGDADCASM